MPLLCCCVGALINFWSSAICADSASDHATLSECSWGGIVFFFEHKTNLRYHQNMKSAPTLLLALVAFVALSQQGVDARRMTEGSMLDELLVLRRLSREDPCKRCVRERGKYETCPDAVDRCCRSRQVSEGQACDWKCKRWKRYLCTLKPHPAGHFCLLLQHTHSKCLIKAWKGRLSAYALFNLNF